MSRQVRITITIDIPASATISASSSGGAQVQVQPRIQSPRLPQHQNQPEPPHQPLYQPYSPYQPHYDSQLYHSHYEGNHHQQPNSRQHDYNSSYQTRMSDTPKIPAMDAVTYDSISYIYTIDKDFYITEWRAQQKSEEIGGSTYTSRACTLARGGKAQVGSSNPALAVAVYSWMGYPEFRIYYVDNNNSLRELARKGTDSTWDQGALDRRGYKVVKGTDITATAGITDANQLKLFYYDSSDDSKPHVAFFKFGETNWDNRSIF